MKPIPDIEQALALLNLGRHKAALRAVKAALRGAPDSPPVLNLQGICQAGTGDHIAACNSFTRALRRDPGFDDARRNLAQSLIILGRHGAARPHLARLSERAPRDAGAWYLLAQCDMAEGDIAAAEAAASQAVACDRAPARALNLRGLIRDRAGDLIGAIADFEAALAADPAHVEALVNLALPLARLTRFVEARAALDRALALAPDHLTARLRLAMTDVQTGRLAEAAAGYRAVLEQNPHQAEAIEQLAQLIAAPEAPALIARARAAIPTQPPRSEARAGLHFAQARLAEICGDAAEARRQRNEANRLMARLLPYDPMADARLAGRILDRFPTPAPAPAAAPPGTGPDAAPAQFFIIGLPRSGTTLAEAILAAHPAVAALGERSAAGRLLQPVIDADLPFDAAAIARFRDGDRALLPPLPPRTRAYTDKMPENYRLLGFLGAAYPRARFVLVTRDPRDVALSMWKAHFSGTALNYCYDLTAMAHRFNLFARMMAHWQAHLPGRILTLPYEEIVQDIEGASRRLACFCGLDWLPAMTRPEENPAPVLTLTATQLRQPVHRRSVGGWRAHAEELDPFLKALDPTLWPDLPG